MKLSRTLKVLRLISLFLVFFLLNLTGKTHIDQDMKCSLCVSICLYIMKIKACVVEGCSVLRRASTCLQSTERSLSFHLAEHIVHLVHVVGRTQLGATTLGSRDVTIQDCPWVTLTGLYTHRCAGPWTERVPAGGRAGCTAPRIMANQ